MIQEGLQGFRDERAFRTAPDAMHALPIVASPLTQELFDNAVDVYRASRGLDCPFGQGSTVSSRRVRCHALPVLHHDRDFDLIARVLALESRRLPHVIGVG